MWRLVYAPHKLSPIDRRKLSKCLEDHTFTCGSSLADLDLTDTLSDVCVRYLNCCDPDTIQLKTMKLSASIVQPQKT